MSYREQILATLSTLRWELREIEADGNWWFDEAWKLESVGESYGRRLYLTFLVDPQWEGPRLKGQGVWSIRASSEPLKSQTDTSTLVSDLCMVKQRFDVKLTEFREAIQTYQRAAV